MKNSSFCIFYRDLTKLHFRLESQNIRFGKFALFSEIDCF